MGTDLATYLDSFLGVGDGLSGLGGSLVYCTIQYRGWHIFDNVFWPIHVGVNGGLNFRDKNDRNLAFLQHLKTHVLQHNMW